MPYADGLPVELGIPRSPDGEPKGAEIGIESVVIRRVTVSLTAARPDPVLLNLAGSWLWAIDTVGANANVDVYFNDASGQPVTFRRGLKLSNYRFHRIFLQHTAQPGASITFHSSMQPVDIENSSPSIAATLTVPSLLAPAQVALNNGAQTLISAASAGTKRRVHVNAALANTARFGVGGNGVTAATAYGELGPGDNLVLETEGDVYAFVTGAGNVAQVLAENL